MPDTVPYLAGYRDHGIPRAIPVRVEKSTPQKEGADAVKQLESHLKEPARLDEKKQKPLFWNDSRVKDDSPDAWNWRHSTVLGRIVWFFEQVWLILTFFWPRRPRLVDQKLMASLCANRLKGALFGLKPPSLSQILKHSVLFLEKEGKKSKVPQDLVKRLRQCMKWSEKIENAQMLLASGERKQKLEELGKSISRGIKALRLGQSCIIPGGWQNKEGSPHQMLYEVKRIDEKSYGFKLISRDPHVSKSSVLASLGKTKIHPVTAFENLSCEEVSDPLWLQALLSLQVFSPPKSPLQLLGGPKKQAEGKNEKSAGKEEKKSVKKVPLNRDRSSICSLLKSFQDRYVEPSKAIEECRTSSVGSTQAKNVWTLVDLVANPGERKTREVMRRKLRLKVNILFEFFTSTASNLKGNKTNQALLDQGVQNVARLASLMYQKGFLNKLEIGNLNKECAVIEKYVNEAKNPKGKTSKSSPFHDSSSPDSYVFDKPKTTFVPYTTQKFGTGKTYAYRDNGAVHPSGKVGSTPIQALNPIPKFQSDNVANSLKKLRKECEGLLKMGNDFLVQDRIMEILRSLEFKPKIERKNLDVFPLKEIPYKKSYRKVTDEDLWGKVKPEDTVTCSRELHQLSKMLTNSSEKTSSIYPDRLLLLIKAAAIQDRLARVNAKNSGVKEEYTIDFWSNIRRRLVETDNHFFNKFFSKTISGDTSLLKDDLAEYHSAIWDTASALRTKKREEGGTYQSHSKIEDLKKTFSDGKLPEQIVDMDKQIELLMRITPYKREKIGSDYWSYNEYSAKLGNLHQSWERHYAHTPLRKVARFGDVAEGDYSNNWTTQEAITDDPFRVAQQYSSKQKTSYGLSSTKKKNTHPSHEKQTVPEKLSKEDLRDLLYNAKRGVSAIVIMGFIKDKRYLLDLPDVRHLLEDILLKNLDFELNNDSNLIEELSNFLKNEIAIFQNAGKLEPMLFLMSLSQKLRGLVKNHLSSNTPRFKQIVDYTSEIKKLAKQAINEKSAYYPFRHLLWKEVLISFQDHKTLDGEDASLIAQAIAVLGSTSPELIGLDPAQQDLVERLKGRLAASLKSILEKSDDLRKSVLDTICLQSRCKLPQDSWAGSFPLYKAGPYEINIVKGTVFNHADGSFTAAIPTSLIKTPEVMDAFSNVDLSRTAVSSRFVGKTTHYLFKDNAGVDSRVVKTEKELRLYKNISLPKEKGEQKVWAQYVSRKTLFPEDTIDFEKYKKEGVWGIIKLFFIFLFKKKQKAPIPQFLFNPDYRFWLDPKKPEEAYILDTEGKLQFKLFFKNTWSGGRVLEYVSDFRNGAVSGKQKVYPMDKDRHPFWENIARFEEPGKVMVWRKGKTITRIELLRFGLTFVEKDGKAVCTTPRLRGWVVDDSHQVSLVRKNIPHGLVLRHPTIKNKHRVIVPKQTIVPNTNMDFSSMLSLGYLFKALIAKIRGRSINLPEVKDPLSRSWGFERGRGKYDYWMFDVDSNTLELQEVEGKKSIEAYLYLSKVALFAREPERSLEFLHQADKGSGDLLSKGAVKNCLNIGGVSGDVPKTPNAVALSLHARLLLAKKGPHNNRVDYNKDIAKLYLLYLQCGGSIDVGIRISEAEELYCVESLQKYDRESYKKHAPLLTTVGGDEKRAMNPSFERRSFYDKTGAPSGKISNYIKKVMETLTQWMDPKKSVVKFMSRDVSHLGRHFIDLYKVASTSDMKSDAFRKMELTLKALPSYKVETMNNSKGESSSGSRLDGERDFYALLQHYLTTVIEVRRGGARQVNIPAAPDFDWKKAKQYEKDLKKYDNEKYRYPKLKPPEDPNIDRVRKLLEELDTFIDKFFDQKAANRGYFDPACTPVEEIFIRNAAKDLQSAFARLDGEKRLDQLPIPKLVEKLQTSIAQTVKSDLKSDHGQALYKANDVEKYFVKGTQTPFDLKVDFSNIKGSNVKYLDKAAKLFEEDLENANKLRKSRKDCKLKDEKTRLELEKVLIKREKGVSKKAAVLRKEIEKMISLKVDDIAAVKRCGRLIKELRWEDVIKHYLQQDLKAIEKLLPKDIKLSDLSQKVFDYLIIASERQRLDSALDAVRKMGKDFDGITSIASQNLFEILTATRQYDPTKDTHLLIFEYLSGILLRGKQLEMVQALLKDKDCVRQAITGAGKTSVILILTALMKANGKNLVTVQFPKPLYKENLKHLQVKLGKVFNRDVYALQYNMSTSLSITKKDDDGNDVNVSFFKEMYQNLVKTVLKKGSVATTLESLQALEQKWIALLDKYSKAPPVQDLDDEKKNTNVSKLDREHFIYLSKILHLMRESREDVIDEFDKALNPREERHLRIGDPEPVPSFIWKTTMEIYDKLLEHEKELGLRRNIHAYRTENQRDDILKNVANSIAEDWATKKGVQGPEKRKAFVTAFVEYVRGENEKFIEPSAHEYGIKDWHPKELDCLAVIKDQFNTFLPLTLCQRGQVKYIRSEDGVHTIPCLAADVPKEGSQYEQILERMNYTIQDYYYKGIDERVFSNWIKQLKIEAQSQFESGEAKTIADSAPAKLFKDYFPKHSLSEIQEYQVENLLKQMNEDTRLTTHLQQHERKKLPLRRFMEKELAGLELWGSKITCDAQNLISSAKHSCGASATLLGLNGVHPRINHSEARDEGTGGEMAIRLVEKCRVNGTVTNMLKYDYERPKDLLLDGIKSDKAIHSLIDGAAALHGIPPKGLAKQLLEHQLTIGSKIKGVVYSEKGHMHVLTKDGKEYRSVPRSMTDLKPDELGMVLSEKESRGADVRLGAFNRALVSAHPGQCLSDVLQTAGRMRGREQLLRYIAPKGSGLKTPQQLLSLAVENEAKLEADNQFRAEKQKLRDILRNQMLKTLEEQAATLTDENFVTQIGKLLATYRNYEPSNILVTRKEQFYEDAGSYFEAHKQVDKKNSKPLDVLNDIKDRYVKIAEEVGLGVAVRQYGNLKYFTDPTEKSRMAACLEERVFMKQTGEEVQVDTDIATETEVETKVEVLSDEQIHTKTYLPWLSWYSFYFETHKFRDLNPAFSKKLSFTENFLPLNRKNRNLDRQWLRWPFDSKQNPAYHAFFERNRYDSKIKDVKVIDINDLNIQVLGGLYSESYVYDLRRKRIFACRPGENVPILSDEEKKKQNNYVAQIRFFDGQYQKRKYTKDEWGALEEWLVNQETDEEGGIKLEKYFLTNILKNRFNDREMYKFSSLKKLFKLCKARKKLSQGKVDGYYRSELQLLEEWLMKSNFELVEMQFVSDGYTDMPPSFLESQIGKLLLKCHKGLMRTAKELFESGKCDRYTETEKYAMEYWLKKQGSTKDMLHKFLEILKSQGLPHSKFTSHTDLSKIIDKIEAK